MEHEVDIRQFTKTEVALEMCSIGWFSIGIGMLWFIVCATPFYSFATPFVLGQYYNITTTHEGEVVSHPSMLWMVIVLSVVAFCMSIVLIFVMGSWANTGYKCECECKPDDLL